MTSSSRKLLFYVEAEGDDGTVERYRVEKKGRSFYVVSPRGHEHLCHPTINTPERIPGEIGLVFGVKPGRVVHPWELEEQG